MPFQKGNKLSKGRPQGSKNKTTDVDKKDLQELFFNVEEMIYLSTAIRQPPIGIEFYFHNNFMCLYLHPNFKDLIVKN